MENQLKLTHMFLLRTIWWNVKLFPEPALRTMLNPICICFFYRIGSDKFCWCHAKFRVSPTVVQQQHVRWAASTLSWLPVWGAEGGLHTQRWLVPSLNQLGRRSGLLKTQQRLSFTPPSAFKVHHNAWCADFSGEPVLVSKWDIWMVQYFEGLWLRTPVLRAAGSCKILCSRDKAPKMPELSGCLTIKPKEGKTPDRMW